MKLHDAILRLQSFHDFYSKDMIDGDLEAVMLGIEALKRELDCREGIKVTYLDLLPGETLGDICKKPKHYAI